MKIYLTLNFIYQVNINNFVLIYIQFSVCEEGEKRRNRGDRESIFFMYTRLTNRLVFSSFQ